MRDCVWGANTEFDKPNLVFKPNYPFGGSLNNTLPRIASRSGYKTFLGGKWHISAVSELGPNYGFQHYLVTGGNLPTWDATCFCEKDTTSCFAGHYTNKNQLSMNYGCTIQSSPNLEKIRAMNRSSASIFANAFDSFVDHVLEEKDAFFAVLAFHEPHLPFIASPWARQSLLESGLLQAMKESSSSSPQAEASLAADYYGALQAMDNAVGQARRALERTGRARDTLVIFTSDNGPEVLNWNSPSMNGYGNTAGLRGHKRSLYEGGHRVPGIIEWPEKIAQNIVSNQVISLLDVSATMLDLMVDNRTEFERALLPDLDGVPIREFTADWNRTDKPLFICSSIDGERSSPCQEFALITGPFKLIASANKQGTLVTGKEYYNYEVSEYVQLARDARYYEMLDLAKHWASSVLAPSLTSCG